jgi:hypothetical protein
LLDSNTQIYIEEPMKVNASAGHESVIEVFLDQCERIDTGVLDKCLYMAAAQGHEPVVKLLLERGRMSILDLEKTAPLSRSLPFMIAIKLFHFFLLIRQT